MKDVSGAELKYGDKVYFSEYASGYLRSGKVVAVTEKNVNIKSSYGNTTKTQSAYIVKVGSEVTDGV